MNMKQNKLENMVYISIPDDFSRNIGTFTINPDIKLPVEMTGIEETASLQNLTWEMIISGMLKILAYDTSHANKEYYRGFILAAKPDIVNEMMNAAIIKASNHDFDIAEEIFMAISGLVPRNSLVHLNFALMYEQRADLYNESGKTKRADACNEQAFFQYRKALEAKDPLPIIHYRLGHFYLKQNNNQKAFEHFDIFKNTGKDSNKRKEAKKIIGLLESEHHYDNLFAEAYDLIRLGQEEKGIEKIKLFLKDNENVWNAWFLLGWAYRKQGQYERALESFHKALELVNDQVDLLNELAITNIELGRLEDARMHLEKALNLEPRNTKVLSNLGILAIKRDEPPDAVKFFRAVLEIDPEDPVANEYVKSLS